ncbi:MAG: hypothetical protein PHG03_05510 [Bacilli bacterium]|nr:hypothetical protein [Bacilli bacterium]MDD4795990.1 hypothetical protein [Bacilli bacterium]
MENNKKLGLILASIALIILIIFAIYFTTYVFKIKPSEDDITTTTTTVKVENNNGDVIEDPSVLNASLTDDLIIAFNNAFNNNYNIKNLDLFESEESKFRYIYTYFKLKDSTINLNYEYINNLSKEIFNASLYEPNFSEYLKDEYYEYEIQYQDINYCLFAILQKDDRIILDMLEMDSCENKNIDYDSSLVKHQVSVKYKIIDNNYIYNSFIIVK